MTTTETTRARRPIDLLVAGDRARLEAFRRGDQEILEEIYAHYARSVLQAVQQGFCFKSATGYQRFDGLRAEEAAEVVQEVFRRAFETQNRCRYDGQRPFLAYLLTIARNHVIDQLRQSRRRRTIELDETKEPCATAVTSSFGNPEQVVGRRQVARLLRTFYERLDTVSRSVFDTRFRDGLTQEATAEALGLTIYKVRAVERKLRRSLAMRLNLIGFTGHQASESTLRRERGLECSAVRRPTRATALLPTG